MKPIIPQNKVLVLKYALMSYKKEFNITYPYTSCTTCELPRLMVEISSRIAEARKSKLKSFDVRCGMISKEKKMVKLSGTQVIVNERDQHDIFDSEESLGTAPDYCDQLKPDFVRG